MNLPRIGPKQLSTFDIPLPTLSEQKRIASILDAADALRAKRRESIAQLDTLLQSTFLDMFGDPVSNPMGWEVKALRELATLENGDRSSNYPSGKDLVSSGHLFISTKNIVGSEFVFNECNYITTEKFASLKRGKAVAGDILITLRGTLGSAAIYRGDSAFINAQLMIVRPTKIDGNYLHTFLVSDRVQRHLKDISTGAAVPQLTAKQLGDLEVTIPTADARQEYQAVRSSIELLISNSRVHLNELEALFASLQQRAFNGQL